MSARERTRLNYDRLSRWYDLIAGGAEARLAQIGLAQLAPAAGETVLEIGFGTGRVLAALVDRVGATGRVAGVDLSAGMCRVARGRLAARGLAHRVSLVQGDAARLPLPDGCADAVYMSFALELFGAPDMAAVLAECGRVLRPAGRLGVVAMAEPARPHPMARLYAWAGRRFPVWVDCRPIQVVAILAAAGFATDRVAHRAIWGLPVDVVAAHFEGDDHGYDTLHGDRCRSRR